jgi:hypothetical protein
MKKMLSLATLLAIVLAVTPACEKNGTSSTNYLDQADCTGVDIAQNSYELAIKDILDTRCATSGCHDAGSQSDGIDLSTYAKAKSAFQNKDCLCAIHHGSDCKPMPQGSSKLSDATIQKIDCWAKNGYLE